MCKLAANTLRQSQYHIQTAKRISPSFYSTTKHKTVHGAGQGSGDAGTTFLFVDEPIIETMENECKCCYMSSSDKTIEWKKNLLQDFLTTIGNTLMTGNETVFQLYSIKCRNQRRHGKIY